jgi:phosphoribosylamine---glycine ligase
VKVLLVGGGAREHAIAWRLLQEDPATELIVAPGNAGIEGLARCVPMSATDIPGIVDLAEAERPSYTIVGPEAPLALGIVDAFRARGLPIFGPSGAAARIEASKTFAKDVMRDAGVPTARAQRFTDAAAAKVATAAFGATPPVIKASGLAAGKGVVVSGSFAEAHEVIDRFLLEGTLGAAGIGILLEEFLEGEEVSVFGITDGIDVIPLVPAQDHKRLRDGDTGPNTGGMGAYAPYAGRSADGLAPRIAETVMKPVLAVLRDRGHPFTGLLYAGLMLTTDGPKVIEFNCRFGDPETEAILPVLGPDLGPLLHAVAMGDRLPSDGGTVAAQGHAVTTVLAAAGYPDRPRLGDEITIPPPEPGIHVFHAGTAWDPDGRLVTAGGRVLAITAVAPSLADARALSRDFAARVTFAGMQYRTDIAARALLANARAP